MKPIMNLIWKLKAFLRLSKRKNKIDVDVLMEENIRLMREIKEKRVECFKLLR